MNTMMDYHGLHLKCRVLLLADVFDNFSNNSFKNYGLCPSHYFSAPVLSWNAMLNMTKVELNGEVSDISNRYSKANNKYLKSCDPKQEWKILCT